MVDKALHAKDWANPTKSRGDLRYSKW